MEVNASNLMRVIDGKSVKGGHTNHLFLYYGGILLPDGTRRNLLVTGPENQGERAWLETYECIDRGSKTVLRIAKSHYEVTDIIDGWDNHNQMHTFTIVMKDNRGETRF